MSWSLQLRNGDFILDGARLGQVSGAQKMVQDLRCWLLEPRGTDDAHPTFGSTIDGGIDDFGNYQSPVIGQDDWQRAAVFIQSEISRITSAYQANQVQRSKQDRLDYGESTLSLGEMLVTVTGINMAQAQDLLMVSVNIKNGDGTVSSLDVPIDTTIT